MNQCSSCCTTSSKNDGVEKKNPFPLRGTDERVLLILRFLKRASVYDGSTDLMFTSKGQEQDSLVTFSLVGVVFPLISRGPRVSDPVTTDCLCWQLRAVYSPFPSAAEDAYVTRHTMADHQRHCLPRNNPSAPLFPTLAFPVLFSCALCVGWSGGGGGAACMVVSVTAAIVALNRPQFEVYSL